MVPQRGLPDGLLLLVHEASHFQLHSHCAESLHLFLYGEIFGDTPDRALRRLSQRWKSSSPSGDPGLSGHYLLIVFHARARQLWAWRDRQGLIPLFHANDHGRLVLSTSPWDVAAICSRHPSPDFDFLAAQLGLHGFPSTRSPFAGVRTLLPGHWLIQAGDQRTETSGAEPISTQQTPRRAGKDLSRWQEAIRRAVVRQVGDDDQRPVAVMVSGGLDSASVVAALRAAQPDRSIKAVAWSLPQFPDCDESDSIRAAARALAIPLEMVDGGELWPGRDLPNQINLHWPLANAYRPLIEAVYRRSAELGCGRIFSGHGGDDLFAVRRYRVIDALRAIAPADFLRNASRSFADSWPRPWRAPELRELGRSMLGRRSATPRPEWLTDEAQAGIEDLSLPFADQRRPEQWRACLAQSPVPSFWREAAVARGYGLQRADPLQDPDLVRLALSLPAHRLLDAQGHKKLALAALNGWVPQHDWPGHRTGRLNSFFAHGIFNRERKQVEDVLFGQDDPLWAQIVRRPFIESVLKAPHNHRPSAWLVLWMCCCVEIWAERLRQDA